MTRISSFLTIIAIAGVCSARVIDSYQLSLSSELHTVATNSLNNDNSTGPSDNRIILPVDGNAVLVAYNLTSLAPIDTVFNVHSSSGTTEYFFSSAFANGTGSDWHGFSLQIGTGTGANLRLTSSITIPEVQFPDFDLPSLDPMPASSVFPDDGLLYDRSQLNFTAGSGSAIVSLGALLQLTFSIDVPDDQFNNYSQFTLRQIPVAVPELSPLMLLALGAIGLLFARRRIAN